MVSALQWACVNFSSWLDMKKVLFFFLCFLFFVFCFFLFLFLFLEPQVRRHRGVLIDLAVAVPATDPLVAILRHNVAPRILEVSDLLVLPRLEVQELHVADLTLLELLLVALRQGDRRGLLQLLGSLGRGALGCGGLLGLLAPGLVRLLDRSPRHRRHRRVRHGRGGRIILSSRLRGRGRHSRRARLEGLEDVGLAAGRHEALLLEDRGRLGHLLRQRLSRQALLVRHARHVALQNRADTARELDPLRGLTLRRVRVLGLLFLLNNLESLCGALRGLCRAQSHRHAHRLQSRHLLERESDVKRERHFRGLLAVS